MMMIKMDFSLLKISYDFIRMQQKIGPSQYGQTSGISESGAISGSKMTHSRKMEALLSSQE